MIQSKKPVSKVSMYLDGFHVSKDDPSVQMEAHHYCNQVNEDSRDPLSGILSG